jgi:uncharacterized Zn-finger protein
MDMGLATIEQPRKGGGTPNAVRHIEVHGNELPAYCPTAQMSLWNAHPRVYLPLEHPGDEAKCMYCGTIFRLVD